MPNTNFLQNIEIKCLDTNEICYGYKAYLKSKHWAIKRKEYLKNHHRCALCGCRNKKIWQLHHTNYSNLGKEQEKDLIVLCNECHKLTHSDNNIYTNDINQWFLSGNFSKVNAVINDESLRYNRQRKKKQNNKKNRKNKK